MAFVQLLSMDLKDIPFETIIEPNSSVYNSETYSGVSYDQTEWTEMRGEAIRKTQIFVISIVLALILLIYLTFVVGKNSKDEEIELSWHDRIPSDVLIVAYTCLFPIWLSAMGNALSRHNYSVNQYNWALAAWGLYYVTSVKQIKTKRFIRKSLWFRVI